ncbi:RHS repeat-associated core domain-containing protein [Gilliamella apis]|uniref:RHS repeat-associated core domain-containing protein n=2 Tax=Gilliamella apis TaxID=1970738 RepID=UPI0031450896
MVQYRYNHDGQLIAVINRNGDTTRLFDYQDGLMVQHQNGLGFSCNYRWQTLDNQPRVIEHWTSDGEHYHFDYDLKNRSTRITDALKRQSEIRYDERYQMTYCRDFGGEAYQLEYDDNGNLITYILPNDNKISLKYDELSRLIEETDPLGRKVSYAYHQATDLQTQITFPDNSCWQAEYDDKGCIISQTDQLGNTTYYYPTEDGVPYAIVDALENRNTILWNELGQVQRYTDCSNKVTEYQYDENLHLTSRTNAIGEKIRLLRKPQGEVTHIIHADGIQESFTYNAMGQLLSHTDGKGQTVYLSRNPRGLLTKRFDPKDQTIIYQYDVVQRLTSLFNENNEAYRFSYDDSDRLTEEVSIDGISKRYSYNPDGYLTAITEMGIDQHLKTTERITFLERNKAGLLLTKTTEDAVYHYQYTQAEQLTQIDRKPTAKGKTLGIIEDKVNFSYDLKGRLLQEENLQGHLAYLYDALDNLTSLTLPDGKQFIHQYYGSGHLHQISLDQLIISDFERDDLHREILRTQGHLTSRFGYDAQGRKHWQYASQKPLEELTTLTNTQQLPIDRQLKSRDNVLFRQYHYDPAGELTTLLDKARGKTDYGYAENGQLQSVTSPIQQEHFTSDAAGNFLPAQVLPSKRFALHNRITDYGDIHLNYDAWGNVVEKSIGLTKHQTFSYDCENRLIKAQTYDNGKLILESTYQYDCLGRRIKKQIDDLQRKQKTQTQFLWQGLRLLQEQTPHKQITYIYEPNSYIPLARVDKVNSQQEIYYYHTDQIGTPLELTNQRGSIVWQANYKAWGEVESLRINEIEQNLRYQGQYFDEETELHYNTFRYYDPQVGRFTTQDPIGLLGGFNLYSYTINPTGWVDPWGWCGNNQPWKTIVEDEKVVAQAGKLNPQQLRAYEEAKDILAQGKPGRNQHVLTGDRKGTSAIDLVGSGKGRGRMRVIFSETKDGAINIHEIVDYH